MRIGLPDKDCHGAKKKWGATVYPNIAIAKIARFHKERGDEVEWAMPMVHYDRLYRSKIFNFTADDPTRPIPQWQKDMASWCNKKMLYCTIPFEDYRPRKNFVCKEYLKIL